VHHRIKCTVSMRTTLDIDDDLLAAAKELARREGATAGEVVSRLLRHSLTGSADAARTSARRRRRQAAGFEPFPAVSDGVDPLVYAGEDAVLVLT